MAKRHRATKRGSSSQAPPPYSQTSNDPGSDVHSAPISIEWVQYFYALPAIRDCFYKEILSREEPPQEAIARALCFVHLRDMVLDTTTEQCYVFPHLITAYCEHYVLSINCDVTIPMSTYTIRNPAGTCNPQDQQSLAQPTPQHAAF
ncbi:uncharacterized protein G2W53_040934 [Senna tora]|uniref:Uncharacterized protein n=1 Tax=Senna tora TaxID=362788 RepID=A0A834SGI5_9FABA|nr:uncharacterized protein G2W53_040934 [Senna tora]